MPADIFPTPFNAAPPPEDVLAPTFGMEIKAEFLIFDKPKGYNASMCLPPVRREFRVSAQVYSQTIANSLEPSQIHGTVHFCLALSSLFVLNS